MHETTQETDHELASLNVASENPDAGVSLAFPDGGKEAWTCLLGSALMMFPSFGFQTASKLAQFPHIQPVSHILMPHLSRIRTGLYKHSSIIRIHRPRRRLDNSCFGIPNFIPGNPSRSFIRPLRAQNAIDNRVISQRDILLFTS